jgi:phosphomannomutase
MPLVESFSGIRGVYDDGLDEQVALRYAYSYLGFLKNNSSKKLKIVIGTDTRPSKEIIKNAVLEALDGEIIDLGIASTPMVEFGVRHFKVDGGIIITASHNEPYWNGFKFLGKDGAVLSSKDMDAIIKQYSNIKNLSDKDFFDKHLYKNINPKSIKLKKIIKKYEEINKAYSAYVLGFLTKQDKEKVKNSRLKIVVDPNGGTGIIAKQILEKLNVKVKAINMESGIFNRKIEPDEGSLFYLANELRGKEYAFAAGFDCDADRVEIMTRKGLVSGNQLLALIADDILKNAKNKAIVVNNATSLVVKEIARKHKAKYAETDVGETNVVQDMYKLKAPIGGEGSSGGVIITDSRCRDGILTLIHILKILAYKNKKINELVEELPRYHNIKEKVDFKGDEEKIFNKLKAYYREKGKVNNKFSGLKINFENSYVLFRTSKTEVNVLRIIVDASKKSEAVKLVDEALKLVKNGR